MVNISIHKNQISITELLYYSALILYIYASLGRETLWNYNGFSRMVLIPVIIVFLIVRFVSIIKRYKNRSALILIVALFVTLIVGYNAGVSKGTNLLDELLIVFLLVFGAKEINFNRIVKIYLVIGGGYCLITIIASLFGIIENLVEVSMERIDKIGSLGLENRYTFGYYNATNMANHVFFILLSYFYVRKSLKRIEIAVYFLICILIIYYTGSRLSSLCIFLIILYSVFSNTKKHSESLLSKYWNHFLIYSTLIFLMTSYLMTVYFDSENLIWMIVDFSLSGRLTLGSEAINEYGIPLWGQLYETFGSRNDDGSSYNYLDCAYIQSLVVYGVIYTFSIICAYIAICKRAYQNGQIVLLFSIFMASLSGLIAQHFIQIFENPFLLSLFAEPKFLNCKLVNFN